MKMEMALLLRQKPLVLTSQYSGNTSYLHKSLARAVNFTRAGRGPAQILVDHTIQNERYDLEEDALKLLHGLEVNDEELTVKADRIDEETVKLTITAK